MRDDGAEFERRVRERREREYNAALEAYKAANRKEKERKRRELHDHAKQVLGRHKKGSPMYKEIERQFKEQVDVEDLETKKKRLQLIRDMHRPLDHQELSQHAMKVQELLKQQEDERNQKQLKVKAEIRGMHQKLGQLKSGVME